ncbi:uncharacterized protein At4g06598 [Impatiens glandulifera]|uniref:uncharacterized protein At4g06598 n=1 Tax=Impatiens glandulifera TaxID=253017 RepID=UPI001FB0BCA3|nr:uncharacterized protein At4g06598 [Impatiens glandulifera]
MANAKGTSIRTVAYNGKQSLLPPKSPFPSISPSYADYAPVKNSKPTHHQRTSSESQMEEQPSWLDDLLNEPESPVRRGGHRRSSSDSFAHFKLDATSGSNFDYAVQDEFNFNNMVSVPSWGAREFDHYAMRPAPYYVEPIPVGKPRNRAVNPRTHSVRPLSAKENIGVQISGSSFASHEGDRVPSSGSEKQNSGESVLNDQKAASDKDSKSSASETETKRAKQQFAQRSRVRKLQYIAELERNVQVLQAEGSEVSAELGFLSQQNLILSMENKALRQRLDNLAQEQLIKHLEHEMLEREMGRLQGLYQLQQQQQQQQASSSHKRSNSKDLDKQFASLSLMKQDGNLATDPVSR